MYLTEPTTKKWKTEKLKSKKKRICSEISRGAILLVSRDPESEPDVFRLNSHISRLRAQWAYS